MKQMLAILLLILIFPGILSAEENIIIEREAVFLGSEHCIKQKSSSLKSILSVYSKPSSSAQSLQAVLRVDQNTQNASSEDFNIIHAQFSPVELTDSYEGCKRLTGSGQGKSNHLRTVLADYLVTRCTRRGAQQAPYPGARYIFLRNMKNQTVRCGVSTL